MKMHERLDAAASQAIASKAAAGLIWHTHHRASIPRRRQPWHQHSMTEPLESRVLLTSYNFTTAGSFYPYPLGNDPQQNLVSDSHGNLYGTAVDGGLYGDGVVYKIASGTSSITVLVSFSGANGINPYGGVIIDSHDNLFGTTESGGASSDGTIFEIASGTSSITTLFSFNGTNGQYPETPLTLGADGSLYGSTIAGGANQVGTIFKLASGATSVITLASYTTAIEGSYAGNLAVSASGNVYGTTQLGGASSDGAVFEVASGSSSLSLLATFTGSNGKYPYGGVIMDAQGNLYGTTGLGGANSEGEIFEVPSGTSSIAVVASFNGTNGENPEDSVVLDGHGNLYGDTYNGGANNEGTLFEIGSGSTSITLLTSLSSADDPHPAASSVFPDGRGNVYLTVPFGGTFGSGAIDKLTSGSSSVTVLASFITVSGANPLSAVAIDSHGNLYGTTEEAGAAGKGTVYEIASGASSVTTLANFLGSNGAYPLAAVTVDSQGDLFGTTQSGGASSDGTVFEIASGTSSITTLASFNANTGQYSYAPVLLDGNGNLYGTTELGGTDDYGTVFKIVLSTTSFTTIASFLGTNGSDPTSGLTLDSSGTLYGTAPGGGDDGDGLVYKIAPGSTSITEVAPFTGSNGIDPVALVDVSGNLYGAAERGGVIGDGVLFEIPSGTSSIAVLASFIGANGSAPYGSIAVDASGDLFGATIAGGAASDGSVFELASGSTSITTLYSFTTAINPDGGITMDSSGNLYGTTFRGGASNGGSVFELSSASLVTAPDIKSFTVDNGTAQRSVVRTLTLTFTEPVTLDAGAITLSKTSGGTSTAETFTATTSDGGTTYVITPTSGTSGGSLTDGNYSLVVVPSGVHLASSPTTTMTGANRTYTFFRLFGDSNGDGTVNLTDYRAFVSTFLKSSGTSGYNAIFDFNGDGTVSLVDYRAFAANYLHTITA